MDESGKIKKETNHAGRNPGRHQRRKPGRAAGGLQTDAAHRTAAEDRDARYEET